MAFDYDRWPNTPATFGHRGQVLDLSTADAPVGRDVKGLMVVAAGNLVYHPAGNAAGVDITITGAPVGLLIPHYVDVVRRTGTTASVATIADD